jgi:hypothetical protein
VPARDRRTTGELLADSDALAREMLLDATPENGPAMVRSWNQLVASAAHLWSALPSPPDGMSRSDPMERLRVIGDAIDRSVRAGHWPGRGPTDDHVTETADNLSRVRHLIERHRPSWPATAERDADTPEIHGQVMHTLYVAAHGTAVALGTYVTELRHRSEVGSRRRQPMAERPTTLEITEAQDMIARLGGFEQLAAAYMFGQPLPSRDPGLRAAAPATRLQIALAAWEVQAHRTLAASPESADLVRVARVQALIASTTGIVTEAVATTGHIDRDLLQRLAPTLEANQVAWSRLAKCWSELASPTSRTDPGLVAAAGEVRAAIPAIATNQSGWATPDQLVSRGDLANTVKTLHLSIVASLDIAHVARDTAADHPVLTGPARIIGMRAQGEAEVVIEQGETRYEGVTWTTSSQIAGNQLIPLPEPARRGLINLTDDVIATTNQSVAAAAQLDPSDVTRSIRSGPDARRGRAVEAHQILRPHEPGPRGPRR